MCCCWVGVGELGCDRQGGAGQPGGLLGLVGRATATAPRTIPPVRTAHIRRLVTRRWCAQCGPPPPRTAHGCCCSPPCLNHTRHALCSMPSPQAVDGDVLVRVVRAATSTHGNFGAGAQLQQQSADAAASSVMSAMAVLDGQWPGGVLPRGSAGEAPCLMGSGRGRCCPHPTGSAGWRQCCLAGAALLHQCSHALLMPAHHAAVVMHRPSPAARRGGRALMLLCCAGVGASLAHRPPLCPTSLRRCVGLLV